MSQVSKLINSIPLVTKEKKAQLTEDIITILAKETDTSTLPLLYNLSQSTSIEDRHCAAKLLYSIQDSFLIHFMPTNNLNLTFKNTYLESSGKKYNRKSKDYELQKQWIKSKMDLDINTLVQEEDFSVKEIRKDNLKEYDEDIQVIDEISFYKAIENNLLSSDWIKRHSAFLFFLALFSKNLEDDSFLGNLFVRKTCQSKKFNYEVTPFLINICLEILKEDKFSDFVNDQTVAPVRECASLLLAQLIDYSEVKELVLEKVYTLLESEDWQEQLSGLLVLKYLDGHFVCVHKQTVKKFDTKFCFCQKLNDLILCSQDEDIKYLSALIKHKLGCKVPPSVLTHALTQAYDISLSTAAILNLMDNVNQLPYKLNAGLFRHPLKEVRLSVVKLVIRSLENIHEFDQFNDLLENIIYNILVEENELICDLSVQSLIKLININNNISSLVYNFIKQPFYQRKENCFDEQYYSLTGVKQLGDTFLINKLKLLLPLIGKIPKIPCEKNIYCLLINLDCTTDLFSKNELKKLEKKEIFHPKVREKYQEYLFCKVMNGDFLSIIELKECFRVYYFSYLLYKHKKILKNYNNSNNNTITNNNDNNINNNNINNNNNIDDITITNNINNNTISNTITNINNNNTIFNDELIKFCFFNKIKEIFLVCKGMFFYDYFINELNLLSEIIEYVNKKEEVFYKCIEEIYNITISIENNTSNLIEDTKHNKDYNKDNTKNTIKHNKDNNKRVKDSIKDNNSVNYLTNIISYYIKNDLFYSDLLIDKLIKQFNYVLLERVLNNLEISYYILFVKEILNKSLNNLLSKILPYLCINKEIPSKHMSKIKEEREKMIDLVNNKCNDYEIKCPMVIKLRKYQVEGVNWISFLYKYGLKGILGDDMGLGKTVQVLTFICSEIYYHSTIGNNQIQDNNNQIQNDNNLTQNDNNLTQDNNKSIEDNNKSIQDNNNLIQDNNKSIEDNTKDDNKLNNKTSKKVKDNQMINYFYYNALILCPSTLVSHWYSEIKEYFSFINKEIKVLSYDQIKRSNFNYKTNFLVLDEGHLLRNKETVLYNKVSLIISDFKILLSGTPIQNNSSDLVNLINLMMKDYLNKSMDLTTLHSKTLSLVLRRLKTEVLEELPEKVISDVIIPMNDLQIKLYNCKEESNVKLGEEIGFKKIHNLLKVCNNPLEYVKNICDNKSLKYKIKEILNSTNISDNTTLLNNTTLLDDINSDNDLNINNTSNTIININNTSNNTININNTSNTIINSDNDLNLMYNPKLISLIDLLKMIKEESKILIFCQSKSTIDLILPYLSDCVRLDGSVKEKDNVINQFKKEKRILIMTTTVGGLGLNLTCADTVIFYEHDWNPFNDLQAMDRAHRLGQKSTVNVLRLIMKDTIEERIMSHQQFKVFLANKLINYENQSVKSMNIKDVIDKIVDERNKEIEEVTEEEDFIY